MAPKISPSRRRSIAVLGNSSSKLIQKRRRAYSMVPGEKLSPVARARNSAPRKSILKAARSRPSDVGGSFSTADETISNNVTESMDMTEVHAMPSRKSLGRRVSFASHAHVRLFEVPAKGESKSKQARFAEEDDDEDDEDDDDLGLRDDDDLEEGESPESQPNASNRRRSSARRRSSTTFTDYGERSMDMESDDFVPGPQDFLNGHALQDELPEFSDDDFGDDMDMTEAFPGCRPRQRSLSLGFETSDLLPNRRRSSIATASQSQSENQVPRRLSQSQSDRPQFEATQEEEGQSLYPSLGHIGEFPEGESHDPEEDVTTVTQSDMDFTTSSMDQTTSSGGDNTQPVEFTIPVVRPAAQPDELFLKLHALTHAGANDTPYIPDQIDDEDDPEANAIVPSEGHNGSKDMYAEDMDESILEGHSTAPGDDGMDLTDALTRLQKARFSLGLPPMPSRDDDDTEDFGHDKGDAAQDDTFTSTEDSFGGDMSIDGDKTVNLTKLRLSMGRQSAASSSMDLTGNYDEAPRARRSSDSSQSQSNLVAPPARSVAQPSPPSTTSTLQSSVFSAPPPVFAPPPTQTVTPSPAFTPSPPHEQPPRSAPTTPRSPTKQATVPQPFNFSLSSRFPNDASKQSEPFKSTSTPLQPKSPSKLPVPKTSAAFAPPKSPRKRAASAEPETTPRATKKQALGNADEQAQLPVGAQQNRRVSAVRRPSNYFAQRKSLGPAATFPPPAATASSLSKSVFAPATAGSSTDPLRDAAKQAIAEHPLRDRTPSGSPPVNDAGPLYPDLSAIQEEERQASPLPARVQSPALRQSPAPRPSTPRRDSEADSGKPCEREAAKQAVAVASPSRGSPSPQIFVSPASPFARGKSPAREAIRQKSSLPTPQPVAGPSTLDRRQSTVTPQGWGSPAKRAQPLQIKRVVSVPDDTMDMQEEDMDETERWRDGVDSGLEDGEPTISIEQFFEMTNIRFMEEITAPRRSMVNPTHLRPNRRRSLSSSHGDADRPQIPLSEFMTIMSIEVPQLDTYSVLSEELTSWIDGSKKICRQAQEDTSRVTPPLFYEFAMADETEKQDLLHQLKLIKANCIGQAKSQWYEWKNEWVGQLQQYAEDSFSGLENDAKFLESVIGDAQSILPALRAEYAQVLEELEQEEAAVAELEKSDKDYLSELKVTIAEQDTEIQGFRANVSEAQAKLDRLSEKEAEIEAQKRDLQGAIDDAQRIVQIQTEGTASEVLRLKNELEALEALHQWRATKIDPRLMEFVYASRFVISIPCKDNRPDVSRLAISSTPESKLQRDAFPALTELMIANAQRVVVARGAATDVRVVIERLSDYWAACAQLRSQLMFLSVKYPTEVRVVPGADASAPSTLAVCATVLFLRLKAKAFITFSFPWETYSRWPMSIASLQCEVKVAYGRLERQQVLDAVLGRLAQATSSENHGCLLDACIEATEQFA